MHLREKHETRNDSSLEDIKNPKYREVNEKNLLHYNMISVSEFPFRNRRNTVE